MLIDFGDGTILLIIFQKDKLHVKKTKEIKRLNTRDKH